jgi:crossover junction endodeoxyribonuclease RuvC
MNAPPRVLGLDLSLTSTGVAAPTWTYALKPAPALRGTDRMLWFRRQIFDDAISPSTALTLVAMEGPAYGATGGQKGHHERAGLWWLVRCMLAGVDVPVAVIPPASLKLYATGKGNAGKDEILMAAARRFDWFAGGNDEADALWLAAMAADHLGTPPVVMPAAHRAALAKVEWPDVPADGLAAAA